MSSEELEDGCNECRATRCAECGGPMEVWDNYEEAGSIWIVSGRMIVGDLFLNDREANRVIAVPPDNYTVEIEGDEYLVSRVRVASRQGRVGEKIAGVRIRTGEFRIADAEQPRSFACSVRCDDFQYEVHEIVDDGQRVGIEVVFFNDLHDV